MKSFAFLMDRRRTAKGGKSAKLRFAFKWARFCLAAALASGA